MTPPTSFPFYPSKKRRIIPGSAFVSAFPAHYCVGGVMTPPYIFGPALSMAAVITLFIGTPVISWYLGLF